MKSDKSLIPTGSGLVFICAALLLLPWLGLTLFYSKGEPREAVVAMSMLQSGDWILPLSYGSDMPYKPPFVAWLMAALSWLLNGGVVNEYISRLPSALACLTLTLSTYAWGRRVRDVRFGIIMALVVMCSFEVFRAGVAARLDMVLTACMVGAIYIMHLLHEHRIGHRRLSYLAVIALLTCATLTKGPVGALLPCFAMGIYCLLRRDRFFPTLGRMLGLAIVAIALSSWWYILAYQRGGEDFYALMYEENIGRLLGHMSYDSHIKPFWYNFVTLLTGLLPWTIFLLAALLVRSKHRREPLTHAGLLCLTAAVVIVGFYCIPASKRSVYLLPAYPFICYGIAILLDRRPASGAVRFFAWLVAVLCTLAPLAVVALQIWPQPKLTLAAVPWWGYAILCIPLGAAISWYAHRHTPVGHLLFGIWSLYLAYIAVGMPATLNPRSDKQLLDQATPTRGKAIYSVQENSAKHLYSLNFYMHDSIRSLDSLSQAIDMPAGTVVIFPAGTDTAGMSEYFDIRRLTDRSADHRNALDMAVRR